MLPFHPFLILPSPRVSTWRSFGNQLAAWGRVGGAVFPGWCVPEEGWGRRPRRAEGVDGSAARLRLGLGSLAPRGAAARTLAFIERCVDRCVSDRHSFAHSLFVHARSIKLLYSHCVIRESEREPQHPLPSPGGCSFSGQLLLSPKNYNFERTLQLSVPSVLIEYWQICTVLQVFVRGSGKLAANIPGLVRKLRL